MKKLFMTIAILLNTTISIAQTEKCGTIDGEVWTKEGSPYIILCDIVIASLDIQPGVTILFNGDFVFEIAGIITAVGTEQDSIVFTKTESISGWQGIFFNFSLPGSELAYCRIEGSINSGIRLSNSSPTIRNCTITNNSAASGDNTAGGGIYSDGVLTLTDCTISNNSVSALGTGFSPGHQGGLSRGGGIYANGAITLTNCTVANNSGSSTSIGFGPVSQGGGIYANEAITLTICTISNNSVATSITVGPSNSAANGGGIYAKGEITLNNCTTSNNSAFADGKGSSSIDFGTSRGGGIYIANISTITNCIIDSNTTTASGTSPIREGSGVYYAASNTSSTLTNCTIVDNTNQGLKSVGDTVKVVNSILYFNTGEQVSGNVTVTYSDVQGGWFGEGNIDFNPIFIDSVFHLSSISLCVDAGNPDPSFNDVCFPPSHRPERNDQGAYGGPGACGIPTGNQRPIIDSFTADPVMGSLPLTVSFECRAHDEDGSIVEYRWNFDGDTVIDKTTVTDTTSFAYEVTGTFQAFCTAVDDSSGSTRTGPLTIKVISERVVSIPDRSASRGATIDIPVQISDATGLAGAGLKITFDSAWLSAEKVQKGALTNTFTLADTISPGKVAISMARATGLPAGAGDLAVITFRVDTSAVIGDTTSLVLSTVSLFDQNTDSISATTKNGLFTVKPSVATVVAIQISPRDTTVNVNETIIFLATGLTESGQTVSVTPDWQIVNLFGEIGTVEPTTSESTIFTATGPGDGLIIATLVTTNGTLADSAVVVVGKTRGDINLDDKVNVQDAIRCLQIVVNDTAKIKPTPYQLWAADCNSDGEINEADALCILYKSLEGLLPKILTTGSGPANVSLGQFKYDSNDLLTVPILIDGRKDVHASGFEITFDSEVLSIVDAASATSSSLIVQNFKEQGLAKISMINASGLVNSRGEMLKLRFKSKAKLTENPELTIEEVRLFDRAAQPIEVEITTLANEEFTSIPTNFGLHQNYPNPFNPTTTIQFDLPKASTVRLTIFNLKGQQVTTLVNGNKIAGSHSIIWDARDDAGRVVPSGVYIYKLTVENANWQRTKKMVFLK